MAKIFVASNIAGTTADCFLVAYENSNLLAEVYRSVLLTAPHSQRNFTIDNINPVMHRVQIWTTLDDVTLNALIGSCDIDASLTDSNAIEIIQFIVDRGSPGDPIAGETQYVADGVVAGRPNLDQKTYAVFKPGYGPLVWGFHIQTIAGGGFEFINGDAFSHAEEYTIMIVSGGLTAAPSPSVAGDISDVELISSNTAIDSTRRGKLIVFNASGNSIVATVESLATVPDRTTYFFNSHQGNQINGEVAFQSGEGLVFNGQIRNRFYLGRGEELKVIVKAGIAYVAYYHGAAIEVGRRIWGDILTKENELLLNGAEYDGTVYKRIWDYLIGVLPADQKVTYLQFDTTATINGIANLFINRGFFAMDLANTKFKVPDMNNLSIRGLKTGTDTERVIQKAGGYQKDQVGRHYHEVGTEVSDLINYKRSGLSHVRRNWDVGNSNNSGEATTDYFDGVETRPSNIGLYPKVII